MNKANKIKQLTAKPQLAPVAVLTITFAPPTNQILSLVPHFPQQMDAQAVLHILRRAEEALIAQMSQAQQNAAEKQEKQ